MYLIMDTSYMIQIGLKIHQHCGMYVILINLLRIRGITSIKYLDFYVSWLYTMGERFRGMSELPLQYWR